MVGLANDLNISQPGFVVHNGAGIFFGRTLQAGAGVSITNTDGIAGDPTISLTGGLAAIETINGDTGTGISGNTVSIKGLNTAGGTVTFDNNGTASTLNFSDGLANTCLGSLAGNNSISGTNNNLHGATTGRFITTGFNNCVFGSSFQNFTTGHDNSVLGHGIANNLGTGIFNILIGSGVGKNFTTNESSNIIIGNDGTAIGTNNSLIIGIDGSGDNQQNYCQIAGILGNPITNQKNIVTIDGGTGQVGCEASIVFSTYLASVQSNVTGDGTDATVICDTVLVDTSAGYNDTTGIYTAAETGTYLFNATVTLQDVSIANTTGQIYFIVAGFNYFTLSSINWGAITQANGYTSMSTSVIVPMTSGDTCHLVVNAAGGAKIIDVFGTAGAAFTLFTGCKIV